MREPASAAVARIVYASQSNVCESVYAEMERIRASALRHNEPAGVHTALLYQSGWFVQWKEGPGDALLRIMDRVAADERHQNMRIVHSSRGARLLSGPWSMAIVQAHEPPGDMTHRVQRLRRHFDAGRQFAPPAVWRQLSTPLRHPGAQAQHEADAFQRVLVCAATGWGSYDLVRWLAQHHGQEVVHRRFAGAHDLDVGTDLVDFCDPDGERVCRVIAMARRGLALPLTQAFLPDYSHGVLLFSGERERDAALLHRVANACAHVPPRPVVAGVAAQPTVHEHAAALAHRLGFVYRPVLADAEDPGATWAAVQPVLAH